MKNFSDVNLWLESASFNDITPTISRAVSRVTATKAEISRLESDYVSAYNSVQTLGYNSQGEIEDQTSADRLTIPDGVLAKLHAYLFQQKNSFLVDRNQFIAEMALTNLGEILPTGDDLLYKRQTICNFGGIATLIVNNEVPLTAKAIVPRRFIDLLDHEIPQRSILQNMPTAVFRNSANQIKGAVWSNYRCYPDIDRCGDSDKFWRVAIFRGNLQRVHMICDFDDNSLSYSFHLISRQATQGSSVVFAPVVNASSRQISSPEKFEELMTQNGSGQISSKGYLRFNVSQANPVQFINSSQFDSDEQDWWDTLFDDTFGSAEEGYYSMDSLSQLYSNTFDNITTITPERLVELINILDNL